VADVGSRASGEDGSDSFELRK